MALVALSITSARATEPPAKCVPDSFRATATYTRQVIKCYAKAAKLGTGPVPLCLEKARAKATAKFGAIAPVAGCSISAPDMPDRIEAFVSGRAQAIQEPSAPSTCNEKTLLAIGLNVTSELSALGVVDQKGFRAASARMQLGRRALAKRLAHAAQFGDCGQQATPGSVSVWIHDFALSVDAAIRESVPSLMFVDEQQPPLVFSVPVTLHGFLSRSLEGSVSVNIGGTQVDIVSSNGNGGEVVATAPGGVVEVTGANVIIRPDASTTDWSTVWVGLLAKRDAGIAPALWLPEEQAMGALLVVASTDRARYRFWLPAPSSGQLLSSKWQSLRALSASCDLDWWQRAIVDVVVGALEGSLCGAALSSCPVGGIALPLIGGAISCSVAEVVCGSLASGAEGASGASDALAEALFCDPTIPGPAFPPPNLCDTSLTVCESNCHFCGDDAHCRLTASSAGDQQYCCVIDRSVCGIGANSSSSVSPFPCGIPKDCFYTEACIPGVGSCAFRGSTCAELCYDRYPGSTPPTTTTTLPPSCAVSDVANWGCCTEQVGSDDLWGGACGAQIKTTPAGLQTFQQYCEEHHAAYSPGECNGDAQQSQGCTKNACCEGTTTNPAGTCGNWQLLGGTDPTFHDSCNASGGVYFADDCHALPTTTTTTTTTLPPPSNICAPTQGECEENCKLYCATPSCVQTQTGPPAKFCCVAPSKQSCGGPPCDGSPCDGDSTCVGPPTCGISACMPLCYDKGAAVHWGCCKPTVIACATPGTSKVCATEGVYENADLYAGGRALCSGYGTWEDGRCSFPYEVQCQENPNDSEQCDEAQAWCCIDSSDHTLTVFGDPPSDTEHCTAGRCRHLVAGDCHSCVPW